ncbi:MAG: hypothetical protein RL095_4084 [Verrucomicrobiota bacterium]
MNPPTQAPRKHFLEILVQAFAVSSEADWAAFLRYNALDLLQAPAGTSLLLRRGETALFQEGSPAAASFVPKELQSGVAYSLEDQSLLLQIADHQLFLRLGPEEARKTALHARICQPFLALSLDHVRLRSPRRLRPLWIGLGVTLLSALLLFWPVTEAVRVEAESLPLSRLVLAAPETAPVLEVLVRRGDKLQAGQLVLRLDPRDFDERIQLKSLELATCQEKLRALEKLSFADAKQLAERQISAAQARCLEAELKLLQRRRQGLEIRAPSEGVIDFDPDQLGRGRTLQAGEDLAILKSPECRLAFFVPLADADIMARRRELSYFPHLKPEEGSVLREAQLHQNAARPHRSGWAFQYFSELKLPEGHSGSVLVEGERLPLALYTWRFLRKYLRR